MKSALLLFCTLLLSIATLTAQTEINMPTSGQSSTSECEGTLYDSGGPNGNYSNGESGTFVVTNPGSNPVELTFVSFNTENNFDELTIYDGPDVNSPVLAVLTNAISPDPILSTGPSITLSFDSDGSVTRSGWEINWRSTAGAGGPNASFDISNNMPLLNEAVIFSAVAGSGSELLFDFNDGSPTQLAIGPIIHRYTTAGSYSVISIDNRCEGSDLATGQVTVSPGTSVDVDFEPICDTLLIGNMAQHDITVTNTGNGPSALGATSPVFGEMDQVYTTIDITNDRVEAGDFNVATINVDATGLIPGTYETSYTLHTSDIDAPDVIIPVKLVVVGTPLPTFAPDLIDFGVVFTGQPATESFTIGNAGSDTYDVESVTITTNPDNLFSVTDIAYSPAAFSDSTFALTFLGTETLGTYSGEVTIVTNLGTFVIPFTVELALPPIAVLDPEEFCITVDAESVTDTFINLANDGPIDLDYTLANFGFNEFSSIDFDETGAVTVHEFGPLPSILTEIEVIVTLTGDFSAGFESASMTVNDFFFINLEDNDLFDGNPDEISVMVPLADYDGGPVTITIENSDDVAPGFFFDSNHSVAFNIQPAEWLVIEEQSGTLGANTETNIPFTIDATGLNGGTYTGQLIFTSNDPEIPARLIDVKIIVIGSPVLVLEPDTLDFGDVFVTTSASLPLLISNEGSDTLFIDEFFFTNGRYTIDTNFLAIPADESYLATVTYTPTSMGASNGNMELFSNTGQFIGSVRLMGTGIDVPQARFEPGEICLNLLTGADTTASMTLFNDGFGDLNYAFSVGAFPSWLNILSPNVGTLAQGESAVFNFVISADGLLGETYVHPLGIEINQPSDPTPDVEIKIIVQSPPSAVPSALSTTVCDGIVEFVDESLFTPTSWSWDFGDGNTSTEQNPIHTYAASGEYTVTLEVCNGIGCDITTMSTPITVALDGSLCQEITFTDGEDLEVSGCGGIIVDNGGADGSYSNNFLGSILITAESGPGLRLIIDEFETENCCDGLMIYDGADANAPEIGDFRGNDLLPGDVIEASGTQLFLVFDSDGSVTDPGFVIRYECFSNTNPPAAEFTTSTNTTCDGMVDFTDSSTENPFSWAWDFGDGNTSTEQNPSHVYQTSGTYFVTLEVCNEFGCDEVMGSNPILVSLEDNICQDIPMVNGEQVEAFGCAGRITDAGGRENDYESSFDGQLLLTSGAGQRLRLTVDDFEMEFCCDFLTIYDGSDDNATLIGEYNGADLIAGDVIESTGSQLYMTFTSDGSVQRRGFDFRWECISGIDDVTLEATPQVDCPATIDFSAGNTGATSYVYTWDFGDGQNAVGDNPQHTYNSTGNYDVLLTLVGGGQSRVIAQTVEVTDLNFDLTIGGNVQVFMNQAGNFTAESSTQLVNYSWSAEGTEQTGNEATFNPIWTETGVYRIFLVTDNTSTNCVGLTFVDVTVILDTRANDHAAINVLDVFPNPTRSQLNFNLQLDRELDLSYQVFDATGRRIMENQFTSSGRELTERLDVSNLPAGMYHVTLTSGELGLVATRRFVKE